MSIRRALRTITAAEAGRRVILTAYVGGDPLTYIAYPDGIKVFCSNNPVGTNPDGVAQLIGAGCTVLFRASVCTQSYFGSERAGALIGSTNLSTNALGDGGLFETLNGADDIDVDALIRKLGRHDRPIEVTPTVLEDFRRLCRRVRGHVTAPATKRVAVEAPTFGAWLRNEYRKPFSIITWTEYDARPLTENERLHVEDLNEMRATGRGANYVSHVTFSKGVIKFPADEDILCVHVNKSGTGVDDRDRVASRRPSCRDSCRSRWKG